MGTISQGCEKCVAALHSANVMRLITDTRGTDVLCRKYLSAKADLLQQAFCKGMIASIARCTGDCMKDDVHSQLYLDLRRTLRHDVTRCLE